MMNSVPSLQKQVHLIGAPFGGNSLPQSISHLRAALELGGAGAAFVVVGGGAEELAGAESALAAPVALHPIVLVTSGWFIIFACSVFMASSMRRATTPLANLSRWNTRPML